MHTLEDENLTQEPKAGSNGCLPFDYFDLKRFNRSSSGVCVESFKSLHGLDKQTNKQQSCKSY